MTTALAGIGRDATAAASALRELSYELRPPALDDRGLLLALRDSALQLAPLPVEITAVGIDAAGRQLGIDHAGLDAAGLDAAWPGRRPGRPAGGGRGRRLPDRRRGHDEHRATCGRVPVLGDADPAPISQLTVLIEDDGRGLPADFRPGVGVLSMRERAAELGGVCIHEQRSGGGTAGPGNHSRGERNRER